MSTSGDSNYRSGASVGHSKRPIESVRAASLAVLLLGTAGCGQESSTPVGATSAQGISVVNVSLESVNNDCRVAGTVRNDTPNKILTAMVLTAFGLDGSVIATVPVDTFGDLLGPKHDTVLPGTSVAFSSPRVNDLQGHAVSKCTGIVRVELTDVIFE